MIRYGDHSVPASRPGFGDKLIRLPSAVRTNELWRAEEMSLPFGLSRLPGVADYMHITAACEKRGTAAFK